MYFFNHLTILFKTPEPTNSVRWFVKFTSKYEIYKPPHVISLDVLINCH